MTIRSDFEIFGEFCWSGISFNFSIPQGLTPPISNVPIVGQSSSQCALNLTNNNSETLNVEAKMNQTFVGADVFCGDDGDPSNGTLLGTTYIDIADPVGPFNTTSIWCWANYTLWVNETITRTFRFRYR